MKNWNQRFLIITGVIVLAAIWLVLPNNPGIHFGGINKDIKTQLGLDLVGGVQALLEADLPATTQVSADAMQNAVDIVENRVNGLGLTEAVVQPAGDRRIVVELPGETDPEKALATIRETGLLEFVDFSELTSGEAIALENQKIETDFATGSQGQQPNSSTPVSTQAPITTTQTLTTTNSISQTAATSPKRIFHTVMIGSALKTVSVSLDQNKGGYAVDFVLNSKEATVFAEFTASHVGKMLAIVLDKKVISSPVINNAIRDGQGQISGNFTNETANNLAVQLRYGSLPIPLKVVESRTIGPTLGQDSLRKSMTAGIIGFCVVVLFMGLYYRLPGVVADISIVIYALIAYAIYRLIPVTLTLPGIAGFLLSTGSALDANILIFERLKEELRSGKTLLQAIDLGWKRAWPSIRDSNIATLITCLILFWFGSTFGATIVKGFSLTLAFGVAVSLFTAIVVTRSLLTLILSWVKPTDNDKWFGL